MNRLLYLWDNILETLLRVLPFPCKTGLISIGKPGPDAPVLLTGNFRLTVQRVKHALRGVDAYLLVANSRGINVWCAATGGLLTHHAVISVLKTSGIEELVHHRRLVLPQLAATGIDGKVITQKTGWRVLWGPVYAADLPAFLRNGYHKTRQMRSVRFPWPQRLEMAVAWAFPLSLLSLLLLPFWRQGALPIAGLVWTLSLVLFLAFPLYQHRLHSAGKHIGFVFFDFGQQGIPLMLWSLVLLALVGYRALGGPLSWGGMLRWGISSFIVVLILGLDLAGSTPIYKSGLHEDRLLRIVLDVDRCRGAGLCEQVCPREVFQVDHYRHIATLPGADRCVQCGACIVQCPFDALFFQSPRGALITPEVIRRYKLNLLGRRSVPAGDRTSPQP